jgi:methyltransferase
MVTKLAFGIFIGLLALQRLFELRKSEQHRRQILMRGGREHGASHFPYMALLHTLWLVAIPLEVWLFDRPASMPVAIAAGVFFLGGQVLRMLAMHELGERWCARIMTLPNRPPVTKGIFRFLRHPNYTGVVLEIASAPMLHMAYLTAIIFSLLNAWLLVVRIRAEEKALNEDNNYFATFAAIK